MRRLPVPAPAGRRVHCAASVAREPALDPFELKLLLHPLIAPPALPLLAVIAGLWVARRRPRTGRALAVVGVLAAWLLATPWMAERLADVVEAGQRPFEASSWPALRDGPAPPRAIVVLGGGLVPADEDGPWPDRPAARTVERAVAGARLAKLTGLPVMVCGGRPIGGRDSEAALMRRLIEEDLGVPVRWVEDRSRDTIENAANAAALLGADGIDRVLLVTHAFHQRRAQAVFAAAGIQTVGAPHDPLAGGPRRPRAAMLLPSAEAAAVVALAVRELLGLAWLAVSGAGADGAR